MAKLNLGDIVIHKITLDKTPNVKMTISFYIKSEGNDFVRTSKKSDFVYCKYYNETSKTFVQVAFNLKELKKAE